MQQSDEFAQYFSQNVVQKVLYFCDVRWYNERKSSFVLRRSRKYGKGKKSLGKFFFVG